RQDHAADRHAVGYLEAVEVDEGRDDEPSEDHRAHAAHAGLAHPFLTRVPARRREPPQHGGQPLDERVAQRDPPPAAPAAAALERPGEERDVLPPRQRGLALRTARAARLRDGLALAP